VITLDAFCVTVYDLDHTGPGVFDRLVTPPVSGGWGIDEHNR
jgi:hypothetical protein